MSSGRRHLAPLPPLNRPSIPPLSRGPNGTPLPPQSTYVRPPLRIPPPPPRSPRHGPQFQPVALNPIKFSGSSRPNSPGRMSETEEEQMRIAIMESLQGVSPLADAHVPTQWIQDSVPGTSSIHADNFYIPPSPSNFAPLPIPTFSEENELENELLEAAIRASVTATSHAQEALAHVNHNLSPRSRRLAEDRSIREQQDVAYREALAADQARLEHERAAMIAASEAALRASEEATRAMEAAAALINAKEALEPPRLVYPIDKTPIEDLYALAFTLPTGGITTHLFDPREPFSSVIAQARYDTKHLGPINFFIQGYRGRFGCLPTTPLDQCNGIDARTAFHLKLD